MVRLGVVALVVAGTVVSGSAATRANAAPSFSPPRAPASIPPPPGYQKVYDDTNVVAVSVPQDWTVQTTTTTADTLDETMIVPTIEAGAVFEPPMCEECSGYFPAPAVRIEVTPYEPIGIEPADDCGGAEIVPYDDGRFAGRREIGGGCDARIHRVIASMPDAITVDILFVSWSADQGQEVLTPERRAELDQLFETILSTVEWTGLPYDEAISSQASSASDAPMTTAPGLPPVDTAADGDDFASLWPYSSFQDVPRLGEEPVRGSGCGGRGDLGDVIPDGLWAGYLYPGADGTVELDVACVYYGEAAENVVADGTATIVDNNPDFLVVNNDTRRRILTDDLYRVLWGVVDEQGACTPQAAWGIEQMTADIAAQANGSLAWARVDGGAVRWVFFGCDTGFQLGG